MLAIQIAILVVVRSDFLGAENLEQIYVHTKSTSMISVRGLPPNTFTLYLLHTANQLTWYLFPLSTVVVFLSGATSIALDRIDPVEVLQKLQHNNGYAACGELAPIALCLNGDPDDLKFYKHRQGALTYILTLSLFTLIWLFLYRVIRHIRQKLSNLSSRIVPRLTVVRKRVAQPFARTRIPVITTEITLRHIARAAYVIFALAFEGFHL